MREETPMYRKTPNSTASGICFSTGPRRIDTPTILDYIIRLKIFWHSNHDPFSIVILEINALHKNIHKLEGLSAVTVAKFQVTY